MYVYIYAIFCQYAKNIPRASVNNYYVLLVVNGDGP